jgi:hypothetical protein
MSKSLIALLILLAAGASRSVSAATPSQEAVRILESAPLRFEPSGSGYVTRGLRYSSSLNGDHMDLRSQDQAMRLTFAHASPAAHLEPGEPMQSKSNVIHGNDRSKWRTVPNYRDLHARDLYPGIDLAYYGNHGELEYDLIVKPGANPRSIRLQITGVKPTLDAEGNLTAAFIQKRPVAYQVAADGSRTAVASRYRKNSDGTFGFALGRYDKTRELVIDPALTFSLYMFGSSQDTAKAIGHDANGFVYIAGITLSTDFEIDPNIMQIPGGPQGAGLVGGYDAFFVQVHTDITDGSNPVGYATYVGGSGDDILNDMYVAPSGLVYLTGYTKSTDFPAGTVPGYQTTFTGNVTSSYDAFVVAWDATQPVGQQLLYSSYLGGGTSVAGNGITLDSKGRIFIVGTTNSSEVPVRNGLPSGLVGGSDAFVAGFDPTVPGDGSLIYSTFLGGSTIEQGYGIAGAPDGTLWVVGQTYSPDFPVTGNADQGTRNGSADAFIAQIDPSKGGVLQYSSYLGGSGIEAAQRVRVDAKGRVVITGYTMSSDFPVTQDAMQSSYKGSGDAFVVVLKPGAAGTTPQRAYSTYYGGTGAESATGLVTDANGVIYVSGFTASTDLPLTSNALGNQRMGGQDGFVLKLDPSIAGASGMRYSSFVASVGSQVSYGVDVDNKGVIWLAGFTNAGIFDALNGVPKTTAAGDIDSFLMGINPQ